MTWLAYDYCTRAYHYHPYQLVLTKGPISLSRKVFVDKVVLITSPNGLNKILLTIFTCLVNILSSTASSLR